MNRLLDAAKTRGFLAIPARVSLAATGLAMASLASSAWSLAATAPVPDTMRAAAIDRGGGPEVLTIHHLPTPKPGAGQVLIAVRVAGIGVWEADEREHPGKSWHFPAVLGSDAAGTIAAIGPGVHGLRVGEAVYGVVNGSYAEYATARAENVTHIPRGMSLEQAGALAISGLSAMQGLDDALELKPHQTVIIHGASGAVGTLAVQLAKLRGARVLATATSDDGAALVRRLGADEVVNGRTGDIAAAAKRFAPQGVDAVLGLAGGDALEHCIDALRHDGRGRVAYLYGMEPLPRPRYNITMILYSFRPAADSLERLNKAVEAGKIQVPIAAEYPLAQAAEAHTRLQAGHLLGKIVLRVQ
jgi:NADPH:quinone reductase